MRRTPLQWIAAIRVGRTPSSALEPLVRLCVCPTRPTGGSSAGRGPALLLTCAIALLSAIIANAARRPSYGGELRIETRAAINVLDPSASPEDPVALGALRQLTPFVFETYVRLDERGQPQPWLATS